MGLKSRLLWSLAVLIIGIPLSGHAQTAAIAAATCNQKCLKGFMDIYLKALSHHDPGAVPVTPDYRYTENGASITLGEALWLTFERFGKYRQDFYDPSTGGVATFVSLIENGFPDLLTVRLKIIHHRISQIETIVVRHAMSAHNLPPKDTGWTRLFNRVEPKTTRLTRAQLIRGALDYMRAIAFQDGSLAPFANSCIRLENGMVMALGPHDTPPVPLLSPSQAPPADSEWLTAVKKTFGLGCTNQINTKVYAFITGYEDAHFPIVDVKRQIVFGIFDFMRRGTVKTVTLDGKTYKMMPNTQYPNEILNSEAWKFVDGKITRIEAVFEGPQAYKRGTGWPGTPAVSRPLGKK